VLDYANAIDVPGRPIGDDPDTEFFEPVETTIAAHHRLILETMERISKTEHGRVMFFMPPGSAKSTYASVVFPSRYLGAQPNRKVILASYGDDLARKMGRRTRSIIRQKRYKAIFGCELTADSAAAQEFSLNNGSEYMSCGIMAGVTGNRAHGIIIDDPVRGREQADSPTIRDKTWASYEDDLKTRLIPGGWIALIQCMTGDTPVLMENGREKPLRDIRPGDRVATYDNGVVSESKVLNWTNQGSDRIYEIRMKSGIIVKANARHPFLVEEDGERKWQRTATLKKGSAILRVIGANGRTLNAPRMDAISQRNAKACACRITTSTGGLAVCDRLRSILSRGAKRICAIATGLASRNTNGSWPSKAAFVLSASNRPHKRILARIGTVSCASIIATIAKKFGVFSATTATSQLGMERQRKSCSPRPNTYEITKDEVVDIVESGIEDVFDIEVERTENFIANGLVSHNTRWHEDDLAGRILPEDWKGESGPILCRDGNVWEVVCLQAKCEVQNDPLGRKIGEYLWPEWFTEKHWAQFQNNVRTWTSLYQQLPRPLEGSLFKVSSMLVDGAPVSMPRQCDYVFAILDSALKTGDKNDGTAIAYFARNKFIGHPLLILDWDITQIESDLLTDWFPTVMNRLTELARICGARMGSAGAFVEDKGSGITLLQRAERNGWPATPIDSKLTSMSKDARGTGVSDFVESGLVKITEEAYNKRVEYKDRFQNHFLSQFFGYRLGIPNQADDLYDTGVYGIALGLGDYDGL
jgi:hypothetical protein